MARNREWRFFESRRVVRLALLMLFAVPASAGAAALPNASYGGGAVPPSYADRVMFRTVHVDATTAADGVGARVRVNVYASCNRGGVIAQRFDVAGAIDATGRLRATGRSQRYVGPGGATKTPRGRGFVDLVFNGAAASGTVGARLSFRDRGRRVRCRSARHVEIRASGPDTSAPGTAVAGSSYFGVIDQTFGGLRTPFGLRLNGTGTRVRAAIFGAMLTCTDGREYLANLSPAMRVRADGTFRRTERFTLRFNNAIDRTRVLVQGRFTQQGAVGTVTVRQTTSFRNGAVQRCRTGTLNWTAVR